MIIQCDKCQTKFRLDDSRITGNGVRVRCTKCQNVFIVTPPPPVEEVQLEEVFGTQSINGNKKAETPVEETPAPENKGKNLKFDFNKPVDDEPKSDTPVNFDSFTPEPKDEEEERPKISFKDIDFNFSEDRSNGEEETDNRESGEVEAPSSDESTEVVRFGGEEEPDNTGAQPENAEEKPFSDLDFSFSDEKTKKEEEETLSKNLASEDWGISAEKPTPEKIRIEATPEDEEFSFSSGAKLEEPADKISFSETLSGEMKKTVINEEGEEREEMEDEEIPAKGKKGLLVALLFFVASGAAIYFTGAIDILASKLMPVQTAEQIKTVEIETVKGAFEENKNFGKLFVIEGTVKNISDEPQEIKALMGVLYNSEGVKIAEHSVSPGRVVSADDIKNLPKEELLKQFNDASGGILPPKGTVPVMVLFTEIPEGMSEYGLDIIR